MLPANVIEIRRGSAHCLAVAASAGRALPPASAADPRVGQRDARGHASRFLKQHRDGEPGLERAA